MITNSVVIYENVGRLESAISLEIFAECDLK